MNDLELAFEQWKALAELQLDYLELIGKQRLQTAQAEVVRAVAAQQWAVARMKTAAALEWEASLQRLRRGRRRNLREIRKLGRHAQAAAKIRDGESLSPTQLSLMWAGYTVLERLTPAEVLEQIATIELHPAVYDPTSYCDPRLPNAPCPAPPTQIDSPLALITWLRSQGLVPRRGSHAYRQTVAAFASVAEVASIEIQSMRESFAALEGATFTTWNPMVIAALPDGIDVKKLLSGTLK